MNNGAFVYKKKLFNDVEIAAIANVARSMSESKIGVHADGKYVDLQWFQVELSADLDFCKKNVGLFED